MNTKLQRKKYPFGALRSVTEKSLLFLALFTATAVLVTTGCDPVLRKIMPPVIYVSIVVHNEEKAHYETDEARFWQERTKLIAFADMLHDHGVMLNWQSDWSFLRAVDLFDDGSGTGGLNIVEYLESLGFEIDPHAHGTLYNYADVAYLIEQTGVPSSSIAGGFIAAPPESSELEDFWQPIQGTHYPHTWEAAALWGGGTSGHVDEESLWISGIWKPAGNEQFTEHDENAPVPHIGKYGNTWEDLDLLLEHRRQGDLTPGRIYTASLFVPQARLCVPHFIPEFAEALEARRDTWRLQWVGLSELLDLWDQSFDAEANRFFYVND